MKPDKATSYYVPGEVVPEGERRRLRPEDALKLGIVPEGSAYNSSGYLVLLECLLLAKEGDCNLGLSAGEVADGFTHSMWRVFKSELDSGDWRS